MYASISCIVQSKVKSEIKDVPVLFGEKDVLKTIQLLPGIKPGGDGKAGFFVRGGASDQNLILLDEATVYNASHLLGFFSTFNSDAIKDVTIYKGDMPAQYGGRLSSLLDIKMNDGNNKEYHVNGGIGLIASRLNVEGPIVRNKGSFIISARRNNSTINAVVHFQDPLGAINYYHFIEYNNGKQFNNNRGWSVFDDRLSDGRYINNTLDDDSTDIKTGDILTVKMNCIDKKVYDYLYTLSQISNPNRFNSPSPSNPVSNISNGALGYFTANNTQTKRVVVP